MTVPDAHPRTAVRIVASLAAVAAATVLTLVFTATGSGQVSGARTITLFEGTAGSTFGFVDNAPKTTRNNPHASVGDILAFSNPIFDSTRHRKLGLSSAECVATRPGPISSATYACSGILALGDGTIAVASLQRGEAPIQHLAITGGTGAYDGARGAVVTRTQKDGSSEDTITLLP